MIQPAPLPPLVSVLVQPLAHTRAMLAKSYIGSVEEKTKDLNDQQCEFAELDSISIDTVIFEDGVAGSTMPLTELTHHVKVTS